MLTSRDSGSLDNFGWVFVCLAPGDSGKARVFSQLWDLGMCLVGGTGDRTQNLSQARQATYL